MDLDSSAHWVEVVRDELPDELCAGGSHLGRLVDDGVAGHEGEAEGVTVVEDIGVVGETHTLAAKETTGPFHGAMLSTTPRDSFTSRSLSVEGSRGGRMGS